MINSIVLRQSEGTTTYGTLGVDDKRIYPIGTPHILYHYQSISNVTK